MKKGSPARFFTNIPSIGQVNVPKGDTCDEQYWFCDTCKKHTFINNRHCDKCNQCTSKVCVCIKFAEIDGILRKLKSDSSNLMKIVRI